MNVKVGKVFILSLLSSTCSLERTVALELCCILEEDSLLFSFLTLITLIIFSFITGGTGGGFFPFFFGPYQVLHLGFMIFARIAWGFIV